MSDTKWTEVSEYLSVTFSLPCQKNYYHMRHVGLVCWCDNPNDKHGHIELGSEDGYAFVPFCCYSQAGVKAVVAIIGEEEYRGILDLEEVKKLPEELTEEEKLVIASPEEMKKLARIKGWYS